MIDRFLYVFMFCILILTGCQSTAPAESNHPVMRMTVATILTNGAHTSASLEVWKPTSYLPDYGEDGTTATLSIDSVGKADVHASTAKTKNTMGGFIWALFGYLAKLITA